MSSATTVTAPSPPPEGAGAGSSLSPGVPLASSSSPPQAAIERRARAAMATVRRMPGSLCRGLTDRTKPWGTITLGGRRPRGSPRHMDETIARILDDAYVADLGGRAIEEIRTMRAECQDV